MNFFNLIELICGLAFFLFGMQVMSGNLEKLSGGRLEHSLRKMTKNPLISLAMGGMITIAMQSSSATTVMLVGLVNSGIMEFSQTLNVIFGANIGTTLTAWILSLSGIESDNLLLQMLKPVNFSPILAIVGVFMTMLSKDGKRKSIGNIFVGFAVLMYGMEFMKNAVTPLSNMPEFTVLLTKFNNPLVGVLVGTLFTALIQSSAASIGILQALALTGGVTYGMAIPIVMGQNIGTCVTSLISCIGTSPKAKRVAVVHVSFNIIGTVVCLTVYWVLYQLFGFAIHSMPANAVGIALIHTIFNIVITILLMPFKKQLVKMTERLVPISEEELLEQPEELMQLDERLLRSPSIAVTECNQVSKKMMALTKETLYSAIDLLDVYDGKTATRVRKEENQLDLFEDKISTFLVKISTQAISDKNSQVITKMLHAVGDFERLGDHAANLQEVAKEIHEKQIVFSGGAQEEIAAIKQALLEIIDLTTQAYQKNDLVLAGRVEPLEQVIDQMINRIKSNHVDRLQHGDSTLQMGFILSDLLTNFERISDHCSNVAVAIIEVEHNSFDTHQYLNGIKYGNSDFNAIYDEYAQKYLEDTPLRR